MVELQRVQELQNKAKRSLRLITLTQFTQCTSLTMCSLGSAAHGGRPTDIGIGTGYWYRYLVFVLAKPNNTEHCVAFLI